MNDLIDADITADDLYEKTGKIAVITGASSGIGRATALEFARMGYDVVLAARRAEELEKVAVECRRFGAKALCVPTNVTDSNAVQHVADQAVAEFGKFDVWVNNAAVALYAKFEEAPMDEIRQLVDVNIFGYIHGARAALARFKVQGHGTLINISSVNAAAPQPYSSAYNLSKFAVRGLSHSLRMELQLDGLANKIHVCNAMPASIDTNLFQNAANHTNREVRALEPVYDPAYAARQIVRLADNPQREIIIGPAGKAMVAQYEMSPGLYERVMSRFVDRNHLGKEPSPDSVGNMYEPIVANDGMRGGWRDKRLRADQLNATLGIAAGVAALAAASFWYTRKHRAD